MKYELAIFDMDGTILDTLDDLADAVNHTLKEYGYETHTIDEIRTYVGYGMRHLVEEAVPKGLDNETFEKLFADYTAYYFKHSADKTKPYDGIKDAISELRKQGIKTAVVSNKIDSAVCELAEQYFPNLFDFAVGEKTGIRRKPYPDSVNAVLEKFGIKKENAVYIGDSEVDYQTSINAQMDHIIVTWGFRTKEYIASLGATRFAEKPNDIVRIIEGKKYD